MEQYKEQFRYPEKFVRLAGEIVAAPVQLGLIRRFPRLYHQHFQICISSFFLIGAFGSAAAFSRSRYNIHLAGQDKKRYTDKAAAEKYLDGRKKAYFHLFAEISPPICFPSGVRKYASARSSRCVAAACCSHCFAAATTMS